MSKQNRIKKEDLRNAKYHQRAKLCGSLTFPIRPISMGYCFRSYLMSTDENFNGVPILTGFCIHFINTLISPCVPLYFLYVDNQKWEVEASQAYCRFH